MRRCFELRDEAGDAGQSVHDVAREQGESAEDRDRDDGEDDAVLGHRLPVLTGEPVVELLHWCKPPELIGTGGPAPTVGCPLSSVSWTGGAIPRDSDPRTPTTRLEEISRAAPRGCVG